MGIRSRRGHNKVLYYAKNFTYAAIPRVFYQKYRRDLLNQVAHYDMDDLMSRVNYCNKLEPTVSLGEAGVTVGKFYDTKHSSYYFDLLRSIKGYPSNYRFAYLFGDITHVPEIPSLVKSRPISDDNACSVLMKLDSVRHFFFVNDPIPFEQKQDRGVWRGAAYVEPRLSFVKQYYNHPRCDIAQTNPGDTDVPWQGGYLTKEEQLQYKFIISVEGNDVATNLKWIMSSQSLCFMCRPRYETWFMEGRLIPDYHYVHLKDDHSDLDEKMDYYLRNPAAAKEIIKNANAYVDQFRDAKREYLVSLLVLDKYFQTTGQMKQMA